MTPLERELIAKVRAEGPLAFVDFMDAALYDPRHGYYSSGRVRFGQRGDFTTASGLDAFFGVAVAGWALDVWRSLGRPARFVYAEVGPGTGRLAADVAAAISSVEDRPARLDVLLVERSRVLAARADARVAGRHVATLVGERFEGVVVANELVDALPVRRLRRRSAAIEECFVDVGERGELRERWSEPQSPVANWVADRLESGRYEIEDRPESAAFIQSIAGSLARGGALVVDYGGPRDELFGAHRPHGTIRGFRDHRQVTTPLAEPGLVDLTADVDFTSLADAAVEWGLEPMPLRSLRDLLTAYGLLSVATSRAAPDGSALDRLPPLLALKQFIMPGGIGSAMRVLELIKT